MNLSSILYIKSVLLANDCFCKLDVAILFCCSVTVSRPTLCDPVDCSTPGFPVLHCLLEFAQTLVL